LHGGSEPARWSTGQVLQHVIDDNTLHEQSLSNEVTDTVSSCEEQTSPSNSTTVLDVASDNLPTEMEDALSNVSI